MNFSFGRARRELLLRPRSRWLRDKQTENARVVLCCRGNFCKIILFSGSENEGEKSRLQLLMTVLVMEILGGKWHPPKKKKKPFVWEDEPPYRLRGNNNNFDFFFSSLIIKYGFFCCSCWRLSLSLEKPQKLPRLTLSIGFLFSFLFYSPFFDFVTVLRWSSKKCNSSWYPKNDWKKKSFA